ncbi:MAG: extracellular solute-binding protein, partial [Alphaproteobacteria bacterium]|nr:extracellular solute-binding protein [Alphaproteobacteria bacterium]
MLKLSSMLAGASLLGLAATSGIAHADGVTLHALMEDVPETHIIEALLPDFEKETGIKVEFEKVGYGDMHDKLVPQLTAPQSEYNLLEVDFLWAGEFPKAGWLTDLSPLIASSKFDTSGFIPSTFTLLGGTPTNTSLIPMYNYSMGLLYRVDLLEDQKLKDAYKAQFGK